MATKLLENTVLPNGGNKSDTSRIAIQAPKAIVETYSEIEMTIWRECTVQDRVCQLDSGS